MDNSRARGWALVLAHEMRLYKGIGYKGANSLIFSFLGKCNVSASNVRSKHITRVQGKVLIPNFEPIFYQLGISYLAYQAQLHFTSTICANK